MIVVYQALTNQNDIRHVICKFNIITYGAIIIMYPLIIITNLGTPLFLIFSLIFLPQIYTNAIAGRRPNLNSTYYNEFLLYRFLIIVILYFIIVVFEMFSLQYF